MQITHSVKKERMILFGTLWVFCIDVGYLGEKVQKIVDLFFGLK